MSNIAPADIRREIFSQKWIQNIKDSEKETPFNTVFKNTPTTSRLKSRKPFYLYENQDFNPDDAWKTECGGDIEDCSKRLPGFETAKRKPPGFSAID